MNFLNVSTYGTSASTTRVLVLDTNNVVTSRTANEIVSDGGGGAAAPRTQTFLLGAINGTGTSEQITINSGVDGYGFPHDGVDNQATSLSKAAKFALNFKPTNFRVTANVMAPPTYSGTTPTTGNFGFKIQWSVDGTNWNDFSSTLNFRATTTGSFVDTSGTFTVTGYTTGMYVRLVCVNTLGSSPVAGYVNVRNVSITFWN